MLFHYYMLQPQRKTLERAVEQFGKEHQLLKCAEELRELADECENRAKGANNLGALAWERADVEIVLYQLDNLIAPEIEGEAVFVLNKQLSRLKETLDYLQFGEDRNGKNAA